MWSGAFTEGRKHGRNCREVERLGPELNAPLQRGCFAAFPAFPAFPGVPWVGRHVQMKSRRSDAAGILGSSIF